MRTIGIDGSERSADALVSAYPAACPVPVIPRDARRVGASLMRRSTFA